MVVQDVHLPSARDAELADRARGKVLDDPCTIITALKRRERKKVRKIGLEINILRVGIDIE